MKDSGTEAAVIEWSSTARTDPLAADLVPGTSTTERSALAALGGLALSLVGPDIADGWPEALRAWATAAPVPSPDLVRSVRKALRSDASDPLTKVYEQLVSGPNRRRLGTFFTPPAVVELMLDRIGTLVGVPSEVVDPGAGVGAFTVAARSRWSARSTRVVSVDVNVVTLGLLAARCAVQGVRGVDIVHDDYLSWITSAEKMPQGPRLILGNPPYTRHQELSAKTKEAARLVAGELIDSGLAGLSAYFLAASIAALRDEDALCLLLPGSWTEARYGRPLRESIWGLSDRRVEIHGFPVTAEVFPGTRVTAMVVVVGPRQDHVQSLTTHQASLTPDTAATEQGVDRPRSGPMPDDFGRWLWPHQASKAQEPRVTLDQVARVRRGIATGANHFFYLDDSEIKYLPRAAIQPAVRRLRHIPGDVLDEATHREIGEAGHPRWLLAIWDEELVAGDDELRYLISKGEREGVHLGYLTSDRKVWYAVERIDPPHVLLALASKGRLRAVHNKIGALPSNSMYGLYLKDPRMAPTLVGWLNGGEGQVALKAVGRHYSDGLIKLEPGAVLRVRVPGNGGSGQTVPERQCLFE